VENSRDLRLAIASLDRRACGVGHVDRSGASRATSVPAGAAVVACREVGRAHSRGDELPRKNAVFGVSVGDRVDSAYSTASVVNIHRPS